MEKLVAARCIDRARFRFTLKRQACLSAFFFLGCAFAAGSLGRPGCAVRGERLKPLAKGDRGTRSASSRRPNGLLNARRFSFCKISGGVLTRGDPSLPDSLGARGSAIWFRRIPQTRANARLEKKTAFATVTGGGCSRYKEKKKKKSDRGGGRKAYDSHESGDGEEHGDGSVMSAAPSGAHCGAASRCLGRDSFVQHTRYDELECKQ